MLQDAGEGLPFEVTDFWGEAGAGPIELEKQQRTTRSMFPDGLVTLKQNAAGGNRQRGLFVEADTGSQRGAHITDKIHQYAELYLSELLARDPEPPAGQEERKLVARRPALKRPLPHPVVMDDGRLTPVVFVSYYGQRTGVLRKTHREGIERGWTLRAARTLHAEQRSG